MSETDLELQKQTTNVSVTEIMEEIDNVKVTLEKNSTQEYIKGE